MFPRPLVGLAAALCLGACLNLQPPPQVDPATGGDPDLDAEADAEADTERDAEHDGNAGPDTDADPRGPCPGCWSGERCLAIGEGSGQCTVCDTDGSLIGCPYGCDGEGACRRVEQLSCGSHCCARLDDGSVWCWGPNGHAQVGLEPSGKLDVRPPTPITVSAAGRIDAGRAHTCALTTLGGVRCWGQNDLGQLGQTRMPWIAFAGVVTSLEGPVVGLATSMDTTCAVTGSGKVSCWGIIFPGAGYDYFQDPLEASHLPIGVDGFDSVQPPTRLAVGGLAACAAVEDGHAIRCWGSDHDCQIGDGEGDGGTPYPIQIWSDSALEVLSLSAGDTHFCAALGTPEEGGQVRCWGGNGDAQSGQADTKGCVQVPTPVAGLDHIVEVSAGINHNCALDRDGAVYCWGSNLSGNLGHLEAQTTHLPSKVSGLLSVTHVDAGLTAVCALEEVGFVRCWGSDASGNLGSGHRGDLQVPTPTLIVFPSE